MSTPPLPPTVTIREVGPRDGLQPEQPLAIVDRLALIRALVDAGLRQIEAAAFVSPKAVPAMASAGEVFAQLPAAAGVTWWALVPNVKGAQLATAVGVDHLSVTVSASEEYSRRNVHLSVAESVAEAGAIITLASRWDADVDVVISCAFGSPYEGDIAPEAVASITNACRDAGATVTLADTTGVASPRRVEALVALTGASVGMHLHDTRGTALLNAYAAMQLGVVRFDTAVGGLGGSPFAAGAGGNLATEDLVHLCDDAGIETGISLERLLAASQLVSTLVGRAVPSRVAAAGPRDRLTPVLSPPTAGTNM